MKRSLFLTGVLACMLVIGIKPVQAQQVGLDSAIWSAAAGLSSGIVSGARVAVLAMEVNSPRMSDYLINEMSSALIGLQGGQGFTTLGRAQFDLLMGGLRFDTAGWVDGTTAQAIGRLMDVHYVITGSFEPLAGFFRFRTQLIDVETASIQTMHTVDIQNDDFVAYLMGPAAPPLLGQAAFGGGAMVGQFTVGQRWGTFWLNNLVPGVGSFAIMGDRTGGTLQLISSGLGWTMIIVGAIGRQVEHTDWWGFTYYTTEPRTWATVVGMLFMTTSFIINIVRSSSYGRNVQTASIPETWNIGFAPASDANGNTGLSLSYTRRF